MAKNAPDEINRYSPAERVLLLSIIAVLVGLAIAQIANWTARHRDNRRRQTISVVQEKLAEFKGLNSIYPASLSSFTGLPGGDYTYKAFAGGTDPSPQSNQNCDDQKVSCTSYVLYTNKMETTDNPYSVTGQ